MKLSSFQTVFMPILDTTLANKTGLKLTKKVIVHPVDPRVDQLMIDSRTDMFKSIWTMDTDAMALIRVGYSFSIYKDLKVKCGKNNFHLGK